MCSHNRLFVHLGNSSLFNLLPTHP
ncbi:hypothetical protein F383_38913 [Gossypium arboreum]|uniref:Uncharacterized protein n=1 Tax=Gossypium arboreum TaxID=29729 RepID=A0A0B0MHE9_GOSAR|nr:hypothetical protein F383_38913 [Gossypium arboreum]